MDYMCILKKGILVILGIVLFIVIGRLFVFYTPFLIAYIISLIIEPLIKWICRKTDCSRKISSIIVLATIFVTLIALVIWGIISLVSETTNLLNGLNTYIEKASKFMQDLFNKIKNEIIININSAFKYPPSELVIFLVFVINFPTIFLDK